MTAKNEKTNTQKSWNTKYIKQNYSERKLFISPSSISKIGGDENMEKDIMQIASEVAMMKQLKKEKENEFQRTFTKKAKISIRQLKYFAKHNIYPTIDKNEIARAIENADNIDEIKHIINQTQYIIAKINALRNIDDNLLIIAKNAKYLTDDDIKTIKEIKQKLQ